MRSVWIITMVLLLVSLGTADTVAQIQPSPTSTQVIPSDSDEITLTYDGSTSEPENGIIDYQWNHLESDATDDGPSASFTFERGDTSANTIRLIVTNSTGGTNATEVDQRIQDEPRVESISGPSSLNTDESGTFEITDSDLTDTYNTDGTTYSWSTSDGSTESGSTFSHAASSNFDVTVNVTDGAGLYDTYTKTVSVSSSGDNNDDSDDSGNNDDSSGGGYIPPPSDPGPSMDVVSDTAREKAVAFTGLSDGDVASVAIEKAAVGVSGLDITVGDGKPMQVSVKRSDQDPPETQDLPGPAYQHLEMTLNTSDADTTPATINFSVSQAWIENQSTEAANVSLYRLTDQWDRLDTEIRTMTESAVHYQAETPGFSTFSIAADDTSQRPVTDGSFCGDNVCADNETWETCSEDCEKPEQVQDAEDAISQAEDELEQGDAGYDTLEQARQAFENGNYQEAQTLAEDALAEDSMPGDQPTDGLPWMWVVGLLALIVGGAAVGIYKMKMAEDKKSLDVDPGAASDDTAAEDEDE